MKKIVFTLGGAVALAAGAAVPVPPYPLKTTGSATSGWGAKPYASYATDSSCESNGGQASVSVNAEARGARDFIEFLPSCKRHYVDNDKLNNRTWDRAWTIRDERFNNVTNLFLDIEHPETFPRELFDSATSAGAVRGCFG